MYTCQVPSACFCLTYGWLNLKASSKGSSIQDIIEQNPKEVATAIADYERGTESLSILRSWAPPLRKMSQEHAEARWFMQQLKEAGEVEVVPRGAEECWAEGCEAMSNQEGGEQGEGRLYHASSLAKTFLPLRS